MIFLFNGTTESREQAQVQLMTKDTEGKITVYLKVKGASEVEEIELFNSCDPQLIDVIRTKCSPGNKDTAKLSRRFVSIPGRKILFEYRTREARSYLSEDKLKGQDKYYGRSIIVLVNPGRVSVCVDKRNFGPIAHTYIKDANVTVSILMPKWSRWWKLKHPVYIETCKFETRINLLSLSYLEKDEIMSNIIKCEDKGLEIPKIEAPKRDKPAYTENGLKDKKPYSGDGVGRPAGDKPPYKKDFNKEGYKPRGEKPAYNKDGYKPYNGDRKPYNKDSQRKPYSKKY